MNEEDEAFEDLAKRQGDWGMQGSRKHQILRYAENVENKGTSMTQEALKQMYQLLLTEPHAPTVCLQLEAIAREALAQPEQEPVAIDGNTSDGYHTFNELYEFRKAYNAALFNEWATGGKCSVHKSWRHHDGELCFGGGWFIVVAVLPNGQISNHYEAKDWNLFDVPETERALFEFDGHTRIDVVARLKAYTIPPQRTEPLIGCVNHDCDKCKEENT
jgi:hypothetical protein